MDNVALFDTSEGEDPFELDLGDSFIASGDELDTLYEDLVGTYAHIMDCDHKIKSF